MSSDELTPAALNSAIKKGGKLASFPHLQSSSGNYRPSYVAMSLAKLCF
jgi:hypothetical protein